MNYIVIETQTTNGTTAVVPPAVYSDRVEAESVFLSKCAAACISNVSVHTVIWLDNEGKTLAKKVFKH